MRASFLKFLDEWQNGLAKKALHGAKNMEQVTEARVEWDVIERLRNKVLLNEREERAYAEFLKEG